MRKVWNLITFEIDTEIWHIIPCLSIGVVEKRRNIMLGFLCFYLYFELNEEEDDS